MPRKTKQQKILAELRSLKKELQVPQQIQSPATNSNPVTSTEKIPPIVTSPARSFSYDYRYVTQDLKKVAILATIALLIEVVLSLTLNMGFANLLSNIVPG